MPKPYAMTYATKSKQHPQSGMATILIILIVGISMMALSMGVVHNVKSTQHKHIAAHATAHVQPLAWTGVEVFRSYLEALSEDELKALAPSNQAITINLSSIDAANAKLTADILEVPVVIPENEFEYYRVSAIITAFDYTADASSTVEAVYYVAPPGGNNCIDCTTLGAMLDFHDDIEIEGDIDITAPAGTSATFNVDGNVTALHVSLRQINYLNSTGNITLGSNTFIDELYANGNITLGGSASATQASALGNIGMSGGTRADILRANNNVTLQAGAQARVSIDALGTINNDSTSAQGLATAGGDILVPAIAGSMEQAFAVGNVDIAVGAVTIPHLKAQGNVACPNPGWGNFVSIRAEGSVINCPSSNPSATPPITYDILENTPVSIRLMPPLVAFTMPKPIVDVWPLKSYANYVFTADGSTMRVLVKNVNGIEDGNYYLADYPQNIRHYRDYLCKEIDNAGMCITPATPQEAKTLCYGHSQNDDCLNYDSGEDKWTFNGKSFVPGVMWFEGDLMLNNGVYYSTFLVSGNIETGGGMVTSASNFASYAATCELDYPVNKNETGDFDGLYPVNLCNLAESKMNYNPVGNIALAAGGTPPGGGGYSGGDIELGSSNQVNGTVLAGEHLVTQGQTVVRGYVSATSQVGKGNGTGQNGLGASTTIDLENLPDGYDPTTVPPMIPDDPDDNSGGKGFSKIIWARYR
ncbi:MAG TPA: hypothetical protein VIC26_09100 [Marinagarivorans sp.]